MIKGKHKTLRPMIKSDDRTTLREQQCHRTTRLATYIILYRSYLPFFKVQRVVILQKSFLSIWNFRVIYAKVELSFEDSQVQFDIVFFFNLLKFLVIDEIV